MKRQYQITAAASFAAVMAATGLARAAVTASTAPFTASSTGTTTVDWVSGTNTLSWTPSTPGINNTADSATLNLNANGATGLDVNLDQSLTLATVNVNMAATGNYYIGTDSTRQTVTWVDGGSGSASLTFAKTGGNPLRGYFNANSILNTDLSALYAYSGSRDGGFTGIVSGTGRLTLNFGTAINGGTGGVFHIGKAGDAVSTYSGGTSLQVTASGLNPTNFTFVTDKAGAFGTGVLALNNVGLNINGFAQTVGGLNDGASGSRIFNNGSTAQTLSLAFNSDTGPFTYAGAINDGTKSIALTKSGTGTQILAGANGYTGATNITGGTLLVNGTHSNAGSYSVTGSSVAGSATLGGSGGTISLGVGNSVTANGSDATNRGIIAPGSSGSTGTLNVAGGNVVFGDNSSFAVKADGTTSDLLNVTGNLDLSSTLDRLDITSPATPGTYTIASWSGTRNGVFDAVTLNGIAEPGTFDGTGNIFTAQSGDLIVTYSPSGAAGTIQFQVTGVPEPTSLGLLSLGAVGLLSRRRVLQGTGRQS